MSTMNEKIEQESADPAESRITSAWKEATKFPVKRLLDYIGPTGLWLICYYFAAILMMIILNIARLGWTAEAIFSAPTYFAQLFISFGLNSGKVKAPDLDRENDFYYQKIDFDNALSSASWIFAPMIIYVLGLFIAILPGSGFPQPVGDFDYLTNFRYFHDFVPYLGFEINPDTNIMFKTGSFYFLIAWFPIILASLAGAFVTKRVFPEKNNRSISVVKLMLFNLIVAFIVGLQMGTITGEITFRITGVIKTIFTNSYDNTGYIYTGQYNPNAILIVSWFINFIPMVIAAIWYLLYDQLEDRIIKAAKATPEFTKMVIQRIGKLFKRKEATE